METEPATDYAFYLNSCAKIGLRPFSEWRFTVFLRAWKTWHEDYDALDLLEIPIAKRKRLMRRWSRLNQLAKLADAGRGVITPGGVASLPPEFPVDGYVVKVKDWPERNPLQDPGHTVRDPLQIAAYGMRGASTRPPRAKPRSGVRIFPAKQTSNWS